MDGFGVSFDVWGTLLDLGEAYKRIAARLAAKLGLEAEDVLGRLREAAGLARRARLVEGWSGHERGAEIVAKRLGVGVELLERIVEEALLSDARGLVLRGARDALEGVARMRLPRCVLGNVLFWPGVVTRRVLEEAGLAELLDCMVFSDEIGASKPSRRAFEAVAERMGVDTQHLIHVGDRVDEDVAGVILAGGCGVLAWAEISEDFTCIHRRLCAVRRVSYTPFIVARIARV